MVTVTFSFNQNYIEYSKALVNSIKANSPRTIIVARAVNVDANLLEESWCSGITLIKDNVNYNSTKNKIKNLTDNQTSFWQGKIPKRSLLYSEEISYTCHSRFINILLLLENNVDNIFCIDADFIVRSDLSELENLKEDIHIMHKIENNKAMFTDEDAIFVKNTPCSRKFIKDTYNLLIKNLYYWDADTEALNKSYEKNKSYLKLHQLNIKYKDYNLSDSSIAWSGDGGSKFKPEFLKSTLLYS
jgi:hypothetical protein